MSWPLEEKYLEFPKYKSLDLRGFRTSAGFTHHSTLPLIYAISQSLILGWVSRLHEQHMEVLESGAYLMTGWEDVELRSLSEIPCPTPLWNGFLMPLKKKTCPFPHHLNALLMAVGSSRLQLCQKWSTCWIS